MQPGLWGIGSNAYGYKSYKYSFSVIKTLVNKGITFFDTSDSYGEGASEKVLGDFLKTYENRSNLFIASKVGLLPSNYSSMPTNFKITYVKSKLEKSIKSLNCDYLDLYQLHSPSMDDLDDVIKLFNWLEEKKKLGIIKNIGISLRSPKDGIEFLKF